MGRPRYENFLMLYGTIVFVIFVKICDHQFRRSERFNGLHWLIPISKTGANQIVKDWLDDSTESKEDNSEE